MILLRGHAQPGGAVARDVDGVALVGEPVAQRDRHRLVVFYDENFSHINCLLSHVGYPFERGARARGPPFNQP